MHAPFHASRGIISWQHSKSNKTCHPYTKKSIWTQEESLPFFTGIPWLWSIRIHSITAEKLHWKCKPPNAARGKETLIPPIPHSDAKAERNPVHRSKFLSEPVCRSCCAACALLSMSISLFQLLTYAEPTRNVLVVIRDLVQLIDRSHLSSYIPLLTGLLPAHPIFVLLI